MSFYSYPKAGGGSVGSANVTFPLVGPAGSAGAPTFAITGSGGLYGFGSGGIGISVQNGIAALTADGQGNIALPKMLTVTGAALFPGGVNAAGVLAQTLTVQGTANIAGGLGIGNDTTISGNLGVRDVNASGTLRGTLVASSGPISGDSLNIANKGKFGSLEVTGVFTAGSLQSTGPILFPTAGPNAPGVALADETNSGIYGAPGSLGFAVSGNVVASLGSDLSLTLAGDLSGKVATLTALTVSGPVSLGDTETLKLLAHDNVRLTQNLQVDGVTTLANLQVALLSTPGDASVGGKLTVGSTCQISGATTFSAALTVAGATSLAALRSQGTIIGSLLVPGGGGTVPVVYQDPVSHELYSVQLDGGGNLTLAGNLKAFGAGQFGSLSTSGTFSAASVSTSGAVSVGTALTAGAGATITGALSATGEVAGASLAAGARKLLTGSGNPNGTVAAPPASVYGDTQGGAVFIKAMGTGNTGWVGVSTSATSVTFPLQGPANGPGSPSFAFASSALDGLFSSGSGTVGLATGGISALSFDAQQRGTLAAALSGTSLSLSGGLGVAGATSLAGLTAGTSALGALTASSLTVTGASTVNALTAGAVSAQGTSVTSLTVSANASIGGTCTVTGDVQGARLKGTALLLGDQQSTAGTGDPNGQVVGSPGDNYHQTDSGALWIKVSGSANTANWSKVPTSAALTFPLQAPDGSPASPSYGFTQGGLGITATGTQALSAIVNGQAGWTLDSSRNLSLAAALTVAGSATLQALTATAGSFAGDLTVSGSSTLQAVAATSATLSAALVVGTTLDVTGAATLGSTLSVTGVASAAALTAGGSHWTSASATPGSAGTQGDFTSVISGSQSFVVYDGSAWKQVAFVGDASPSQFPLRGPADSAGAPNFAPRATSPSSGLFSPGPDQLGLSTAGVQALGIDSSQNVTLAAALTGNAATFVSLTCSGAASIQGTATLGSALNLTGAATFSSTLSVGAITTSGTLTAPAANFSGALSSATLSTSGNASIGGNLTVAGTTTFTGVQKLGFVQTGDGLVTQPAVAFQSEQGLGVWRPGTNQWAVAAAGANMLLLQPALATFAGALRVGNTNAGLISSAANTLSAQANGNTAFTVATTGITTFAQQLIAAPGTSALPGLSVGQSGTGLWYGLDAFSNNILGVSVAGNPAALFKSITGTTPIYAMNLGSAASSTINGGIVASGQTPTGNVGAFPSQLFQDTRGGVGCFWLYEGTANGTSAWAKVLTTSSPISPTFPLQSTTLGSASSPAFGFATSGYTTTGIFAAPDAGSGNVPVLAVAANGQPISYFEYSSANSIPIYTQAWGAPSVSSSPYNGAVRVSAQAASGNIIAAPGQFAINNVGGAGTILAVKESGVGTTSGWSFLYTQGTAQLAGAAGSVSAPYHSFSNSTSSGHFYNASTGVTTSVAGTQVFNIGTVGAAFSNTWVQFPAGANTQPSITFTANPTSGFYTGTLFANPGVFCALGGAYAAGFVKYSGTNTGIGIDIGPTGSFTNGGIIWSSQVPTGTANTSPGTIFASTAGTLWFKESGNTTTSGYAQVLTTSTATPTGRFAYQSAAPAAVASTGLVYALSSDGNLYYTSAAGKVSNLSAPSIAPPTSNTAPAATYTTVAADSYRSFVNTTTTQSAITLYTVPSGSDYQVTFVVGGTGGFTITAPSSQVIYVGTTATSSSLISSVTPGSTITLINPGGLGVWYTLQVSGQWDVT